LRMAILTRVAKVNELEIDTPSRTPGIVGRLRFLQKVPYLARTAFDRSLLLNAKS